MVETAQTSKTAGTGKDISDLAEKIRPEAVELGRMFEKHGFELALVGGAVRDLLLGRPVHDYDFTTSARPEQFEPILRAWGHDGFWDMGRKFGTLGAKRRLANGHDLSAEVTTYRSDQYDRNSRKPEVNYGTSLTGDLSRRDFTINCMAVRLPSMVLVDPYNGRSDLRKRLLRTPIDARTSFSDDPLRMMRAVRFVAQLDFDIEADTAEALMDMTDRLSIVSAERIRDELSKLLLSDHASKGVEALVDSGLADQMLPEIPALRMTIDPQHPHKDVYAHTLSVLDRAIALETGPDGPVPRPDLTLRMAALLHDIGKPPTRRFEANGKVSFLHHDAVGASMARKRLRALRYDKQFIHDVCRLIDLHLRFHGYVDERWTDSAVRRYVVDAGPLYSRLNRLTRADATTRNKRKARLFEEAMDEMEQRVVDLKKQENLAKVRPELDGGKIMQILGIAPGPAVGLAYKHMLAFRLDEGEVGEKAAKAELLRWWKAEGGKKAQTLPAHTSRH